MSCGKKHFDTDGCVADVLRRVADAQDEVDGNDGDCDVSCNRSIQELLAGAVSPTTFDTIPLILYCGCDPFLGTGVRTISRGASGNPRLQCIESFFFRVTSVDNKGCAKIELLVTDDTGNQELPPNAEPCDQIRGNETEFFRTGICITVDLSCFCAVVCLDPVAALPLPRNNG